jgi:hypothetical protein
MAAQGASVGGQVSAAAAAAAAAVQQHEGDGDVKMQDEPDEPTAGAIEDWSTGQEDEDRDLKTQEQESAEHAARVGPWTGEQLAALIGERLAEAYCATAEQNVFFPYPAATGPLLPARMIADFRSTSVDIKETYGQVLVASHTFSALPKAGAGRPGAISGAAAASFRCENVVHHLLDTPVDWSDSDDDDQKKAGPGPSAADDLALFAGFQGNAIPPAHQNIKVYLRHLVLSCAPRDGPALPTANCVQKLLSVPLALTHTTRHTTRATRSDTLDLLQDGVVIHAIILLHRFAWRNRHRFFVNHYTIHRLLLTWQVPHTHAQRARTRATDSDFFSFVCSALIAAKIHDDTEYHLWKISVPGRPQPVKHWEVIHRFANFGGGTYVRPALQLVLCILIFFSVCSYSACRRASTNGKNCYALARL